MAPTLIITNDFPPTVGGIETFVAEICRLLDDDVIVLTRHTPGWQESDRQLGFPVVRMGRLLLPTKAVGRHAAELISRHRIESVIFGAMAPLALLAPTVRSAGAQRLLAISHGHECWWATLPGSRRLLRRMADDVDHVSYISDYTRSRIEPALGPEARKRLIKISPPVDTALFSPRNAGGERVHDQPGPHDQQDAYDQREPHDQLRVIAVGRMVRQKGFDTLLRAWSLLDDHDQHQLVLVGDGPQAAGLRRLAERLQIADSVRFTGALDRPGVADLLRTATVFALPVRTRLHGLYPEGFGLVFAEAAATGLPVIVGRSGGAPEIVRDGETGYLVESDQPGQLADRIGRLLADPSAAARLGAAGRLDVRRWSGPDVVAATLRSVLG